MNIIHLVSNKSWGGGEQYVLDLAKEQLRHGHHITIVTRRVKAVSDRFTDEGFKVVHAPLKGAIDFISPIRLSKLLNGPEPTIIHVHNFKDALVAARARRLVPGCRACIVLTRHLVKPAKISTSYLRLYADIDAMIFVSHIARQAFLSTHPAIDLAKISVVHNSIARPTTTDGNSSTNNNGTTTLMYHGRISPEKGIDTLIHALAMLKDLDVKLVIVGTGKAQDVSPLINLSRRLDVNGMIDWKGHVDDVHPLIQQADIGVVPTRAQEAFGLSVLEYMAHGKPVVTTDNGAQPEYITSGKNGLLVPPDNAMALADAIQSLIQSPQRREEIGRNATETVADQLSFPRFYEAIDGIYSSLLKK